MRNWTLRLFLILALVAAATLVAGGLPEPARAVDRGPLSRALLATVRVAVPIDGEADTYSTGSGTVLSADGFVLTNFHVMGDVDQGTLYNRDGLAFIAVNPSNLKGLPTWVYQAEVVKASPDLDLALLKVIGYLESDDPLPASLGLVAMDLTDSDQISIGDELSVVGFPSLGGETVTFTQGKVAGFLDEDRDGVMEWIKTDAEVNHGNSGGLAIDENGNMIGVPTAGYSDAEAAGKISLIRPINLATALLRAGMGVAGVSSNSASSSCATLERHPSGATISNLVFAAAVNSQGVPSGVTSQFDSGLGTVYALFDYDKLRNGREFRYTWYLDDEEVYADAADWQGGSRGTEWVNIFNDPSLPDGMYRLELRYDDVLLSCSTFSVGQALAALADAPSFGPITFANGERNDEPVGAGTTFASGTEEIYAFFDFADMADGLEWRQIWYVDGEVGLDTSETWSAGEEGNYWISVNAEGGLPDGDYLLELYVGNDLIGSGEFVIGGGAGSSLAPAKGSQGVVIIGSVVDANRRNRPIAEALVLFLYPGVDIDAWARTQDEADVFSAGVTDASGAFQLSEPLQPGETYPVVVLADGYRAVAEQAYTVPADATSPFELSVTMVAE